MMIASLISVSIFSLIPKAGGQESQLGPARLHELLAEQLQLFRGVENNVFEARKISEEIASMDLKTVDLPKVTEMTLQSFLKKQKMTDKQASVNQLHIPNALYASQPSAWISYLRRELFNVDKYHCSAFLLRSCQEAKEKGPVLEAIAGFVASQAADDKTLSYEDQERLKDALYPIYKQMHLNLLAANWQIHPGSILRSAVLLGDSRALQKAIELVKEYLSQAVHVRLNFDRNLQNVVFTLFAYYDSRRSRTDDGMDPQNQTVIQVLRDILESEKVPSEVKVSLREDLKASDLRALQRKPQNSQDSVRKSK